MYAEIVADEWRISMSGASIKTGWGGDKRIICQCPPGAMNDMALFQRWLDDAAAICTAHNAGKD